MRKFLNAILFSHIFLATGTVALLLQTCLLLQIKCPASLYALVFFASMLVYNLHQMPLMLKNKPSLPHVRRYLWLHANRPSLPLLITLPLIGIFVSLFFLPFFFFMWLLPAAFAAALYILPLFPEGGQLKRLRDIPGLKIILVTFVFAYVTVILPVIASNRAIDEHVILIFSRRLLWIFAVAVPFDIRDIIGDSKFRLKTLPLLLGTTVSKALAIIALVIYSVLTVISSYYYFDLYQCVMVGMLIAAAIAAVVTLMASPGKDEYYYAFFADSLLMLPLIATFLSLYLFC